MPKKTYTTFKEKFDDRYSSKAKLIKLYNEVNKINENVKTLKDIKTIKQEEKKMIEQGRYKLKKFLKDNHQAVSFYATVYLPSNGKFTPNTINYDGIDWRPVSRNTHGDLRTFFLEKEVINYKFLYNKLSHYKYIVKTVNKDEYREFRYIIDEFKGFNELDEFVRFDSFSEAYLIVISDLLVGPINTLPINFVEEEAYDDGFNKFLSNNYIKANTLKSLYSNDYVINNFKPRSCWLSLLLDIYKEPFEKQYKTFKLTYEYIHNIIKNEGQELKEADNGYSFNQIVKFFEKYTLSLYMFDITFNIVGSYKAKRENKHINPHTLYVIFHNGHIYHLNDELRSLSQKLNDFIDKPVIQEPSNKFYLQKYNELENETQIINSYDDLLKVINNKNLKGTIHLIYQKSCFDLWIDLLVKLKYEASIKMRDRQLDFSGLILKNINDKNIIISSYSEDGVVVDKEFGDSKMFHNYIDKKKKVLSKLLNKNYISQYSLQVQELLKNCGIGGLIGSFTELYEETEIIEIDYNKYYTSILRDIKKIPVINSFDNFKDYDKHAIEDYNLYYVEKLDDDINYPINRYSLCYGFNIKDITDKLNIIAYLQPSKLKDNISESIIKEVYDDESLTIQMKKDVINHTIGMFNKGSNKNTMSFISNTRGEANAIKKKYKGDIIPVKTEMFKVYLNYIEMQKETNDGFKLISHMIYDTAHRRLFDLKKKVESYDLQVYRCNTDCLCIENNTDKFNLFYNENESLFDQDELKIGKLKIKKYKINGGSLLSVRRFNDVYQPISKLYSKEHILNNEFNNNEINQVIDKNDKLIIKADIAGAGKTTSFINYIEKYDKNALFICPWNSLCFNLKSKGLDAMTLDKVIGLRFNGQDFKEGKGLDINDYDMVVFDEIYLYDTYKLEYIKNLMDKHSHIKFYATGDENQNKPIETLNINDCKAYYNNIISSMFFNNITLHENKRCKTDEDRLKIKLITDAIRNSKSKEEAITIIKNNFKIIYNEKDIKTIKNVVALNRTAEWVNNLIHKPFEGEVYYIGLNLICRKTYVSKAMRLTVNNTYEIIDIDDGIYCISDGDSFFEVDKKMLDTYFRLSYARTCHSYQGMSEDEAITIFDINHFMVDIDWIYTAITRATSIENIYIFMGKSSFEMNLFKVKEQIRKMIDGHKHSDAMNDRIMINEKFVTVEWTFKQLKNNRCCECNQFLDISQGESFSIDRIDNALGHYEYNCRVICRRCNNAKK
jgi:hypothetical protein